MKTRMLATLSAAAGMALAGCAGENAGWVSVVDNGKGMDQFERVHDANWQEKDGAIEASAGGKVPAYLVTKKSYGDFVIRAEFWASDDANSGIFIRCDSPSKIGSDTCYEVNIFDRRPDPTYGTAAIVDTAKVSQPYPKAGGKWNTMEITARGPRMVVVFNGMQTVDVVNDKHKAGPFALQWGSGVIKFRKVQILEM